MESPDDELGIPSRIGDRSTSDVIVRIRTQDGRDEWVYCHSNTLTSNSKFFSERLSETWPTCQILDARNCVEVHCQEYDFDFHITVLRLLYVNSGCQISNVWNGIKIALGILQVALKLGCVEIAASCVDYIEAVPWEEAEEEEILKLIPSMGSLAEPVLARLKPVDPMAVVKIFLSAVRFATSSPAASMQDLKTSAQEQLEYMLTEDDDPPMLFANEEIKCEVLAHFNNMFDRFKVLIKSLNESANETAKLRLYFIDLAWACQILTKLETMREFVHFWMEVSESVVEIVRVETEMMEAMLKVLEITSKVLEAIGYGNVILATAKRMHMVKVWLPFVRATKPLIDPRTGDDGNEVPVLKMDGELWQSLESAFVSIILALPSEVQADILTDWLGNRHMQYPDFTEVFEVWCHRSKVANRRLGLFRISSGMTNL